MRHSHGLRAAAGNQGIELPAIGDAFEGGFYAGLISHTADGVATHALIVAPRATGARGPGYPLSTDDVWRVGTQNNPGATNLYDGVVNINAIKSEDFISNHPAANFCDTLSTGGFSDWYLPAYYELEIAYANLKPTTNVNQTSFGPNPYSVPKRTANYTTGTPARTSLTAFQLGGAQTFQDEFHWSSTQGTSTSTAWTVSFFDGFQSSITKTAFAHFRAFRKIAL